MTRSFQLCFALLAASLTLAARAQEASPPTPREGAAPEAVKVTARKNAGDLPYYEYYFREQGRWYKSLPPRPRMVDFLWRIRFAELSEPEQDAYVPQGWAVAMVGNGFEQTVPVARGGYFLLPVLPVGRWSATIMFKEQSKQGELGVAWMVRVDAAQRLSYADFEKALDEVHGAQNAIPLEWVHLNELRTAKYDGLKACFLDASGTALIDGKPAADATVGTCSILKFDPAKAGSGQVIEFRGPLQVVTVVDTHYHVKAKDGTS
jgi:hypothetical protein